MFFLIVIFQLNESSIAINQYKIIKLYLHCIFYADDFIQFTPLMYKNMIKKCIIRFMHSFMIYRLSFLMLKRRDGRI